MASLDAGVANKNEVSRFEVVVLDNVFVVLDEVCNGLVSRFLYFLSNVFEVLFSSLKLSRSEGEEFCGGLGLMDGCEVCGFCEVEREHWLDPVSYVEGGFVG